MKHVKGVSQALWVGILAAACVSTAGQPTAERTPQPTQEMPVATASLTPRPDIEPTVTSTPVGAWIRLTPDSGGPGTTVRIEGYLPGGLPADQLKDNHYLTHADVCWGGCQHGLLESGLEVTWSAQEPGHFHLQFIVPSIPWLASDGLHPLEPGDYPVEILYLDPNAAGCDPAAASDQGCPATPQPSASFHLTEGYHGPECQDPASCGYLQASPAQGAPGDTVRVQGWAPLLQIIGQPFGYDLVLATPDGAASQDLIYLASEQGEAVRQTLDGSLAASFRVPQVGIGGSALSPGRYTLALRAGGLTGEKDGAPVLVAPVPFEITAAPAWIQRSRSAPLWIQPSASLIDPAPGVDALEPRRLAYCAEGAIQLSQDGGQSWMAIPTAAIGELALPGDMILDHPQPTCRSVMLDSSHPDSFYATFGAMSERYGAPPVFFLGFFTTDRGQSWQLAPMPDVDSTSSMIEGRFGGFWTDGTIVQALYLGETGAPDQAPRVGVEQTTDGGLTWAPASLACPPGGPCLRWGPEPGQISGMGSGLPQQVMASFDQGQTWSPTGETVELRMDGPDELVALSADEAMILSGGARYPLRYTPDGGQTWQAQALPPLPGANPGWAYGFSGLQMLTDGSLLAMNTDSGQWWALPPTAQDWCPLEIASPGMYPALLQSSGDRVWWISAMTGEPESAPASRFSCRP